LAGGDVDCAVVAVTPQIVALVRGGKLKSRLVVADEKDPAFPDVPIQKEVGFPFSSMAFIEGVVAPKNLPPAQLQRLEKAFADGSKDPRFLKWADETKTQVISLPSRAFGQKISEYYQEVDKYKAFMKQ